MAGSPTIFRVKVLAKSRWRRLRKIRLTALNSDPTAFLSNHQTEWDYTRQRWLEEFSRGEWNVIVAAKRLRRRYVGLVGITRLPDMSSQECYLEYLWVAPGFRRHGVASMLLTAVLDRLREADVHTVWLYILDGNEPAGRLYQRFGFHSTNDVQPLPGDPTRSEERLTLHLD